MSESSLADEMKDLTDIDKGVLKNATLLSEKWATDRGKRFYRIGKALSDEHGVVYAITEYTRDIDDETGDVVETETIEQVGEFEFDYYHGRNSAYERKLYDFLNDDNEDLWDEPTVEHILSEFVTIIEERIPELLAAADPEDFVDTGTPKSLNLAVDTNFDADILEQKTSFNQTEWSIFFHALQRKTALVDSLSGIDYTHKLATSDWKPDATYNITNPTLTPIPEWRLRAIENKHCGVYNTRPALASVAALDAETDHTQTEIADILDRDDSTISRQLQDVRDLRERINWECKKNTTE